MFVKKFRILVNLNEVDLLTSALTYLPVPSFRLEFWHRKRKNSKFLPIEFLRQKWTFGTVCYNYFDDDAVQSFFIFEAPA